MQLHITHEDASPAGGLPELTALESSSGSSVAHSVDSQIPLTHNPALSKSKPSLIDADLVGTQIPPDPQPPPSSAELPPSQADQSTDGLFVVV